MEAYKGDTLRTIYKSMEIVSERPKQVIVLKGTRRIAGLSGRASGLQRRMIDQEQTKGFSEYCRALQAAKRGSPRLQAELLRLGREADEHLGKVLSDAAALPMSFDEITENYTENELRIIRTGSKFTPNMIDKLLQFVMVMAGEFTKSPFSRKPKSLSELPNLFVFRYALCSYLLTIG